MRVFFGVQQVLLLQIYPFIINSRLYSDWVNFLLEFSLNFSYNLIVDIAGVMELVDIADLKSAALSERAGSSPALGTI